VFDQTCYSPQEAQWTADVLKNKVGRYVFTSTQSTYQNNGVQVESDFDPFKYKPTLGSRSDMPYSEAKRSAEAILFQGNYFPIVAMRIPIVLGSDDYTGRLEFHLKHVKSKTPFLVPNLNAEMSFISSQDAADFLCWLGEQNFSGPINAASPQSIVYADFIKLVEEAVGKKAIISIDKKFEHNPFAGEFSRVLNVKKAIALNYSFKSLESWLPKLICDLTPKI
jgi:nucleoside-diphosphate-sugar epimerase